ncbi:CRAL-TRIO domain-containing protein [Aspergillus homomorphus CBS 101889]|uniref:CRAL/TRIO domain-containing protein n=1 Tax=Aspergillus homomorphus (strain CBS 101889) TaxID=1450537 RepID=A0A395HJV2_ASPHC|nr:CRAL/TRIO domain-containing protein [Aspergillus homomorphus CBS 101889]RAL07799.1 CRAL/TRIO domain-containing protein [Aspergillus homomorphus CBS 101889]
MPSSTPPQQPSGYIHNLNSDQTIKLHQAWSILLHLIHNHNDTSSSTPTAATLTSALSSHHLPPLDTVQPILDTLPRHPIPSLQAGLFSLAKHDSPDTLLLRFLRARKWSVAAAIAMLLRAIHFRITQDIDSQIIANTELDALYATTAQPPSTPPIPGVVVATVQSTATDSQAFLDQMRMGKAFVHGTDRAGRPVMLVRVRLHQPGQQSEAVITRYILHMIETVRLLLVDPVETATILFDMTGFSLSNMEYAPVKFVIDCFQENYPEYLGAMIIHNAPWIFTGIWKIVKSWMDPVIVSKVHFTKTTADLEQFIAPDKILKEIGGPEDWDYEYVEPVAGENERMMETATRDRLLAEREDQAGVVLRLTGEWLAAEGPQTVAVQRTEAIETLRKQYWALDPFLRGRTCLDRTGVIQEGGKIDLYPEVGNCDGLVRG